MSVKLYELFGHPESYKDKLNRLDGDLESFVRDMSGDVTANAQN